MLRRQLHGFPLKRGVCNALGGLDLVHGLSGTGTDIRRGGEEVCELPAGVILRLVEAEEVAGLHIGHGLGEDLPLIDEGIQGLLHAVLIPQELGGGRQQLGTGQEDMAVALVMAQLEEQGGAQALRAPGGEAHAHGDLIRRGEGQAPGVGAQEIGVPADGVESPVAVDLPQPDGKDRGQAVLGQEGHQAAQAHVAAEALGNFHGPPGRDALDEAELFRLGGDDIRRLRPEALHEAPGGGGAETLADAGAQVADELLGVLRQAALHLLRPELGAVLGVGLPGAGDAQVLPRRGAGDAAHHRDELPLLRHETEDRVAVLLILEDHALDRAFPCRQFLHGLSFRRRALPPAVRCAGIAGKSTPPGPGSPA